MGTRREAMRSTERLSAEDVGPLAWLAALLLAVVIPLSFAAAGDGVLPGDVAVARWMQRAGLGPVAGTLAEAGYWLGSTPGAALLAGVAALLFWSAGRPTAVWLVLAAGLLRSLNPLLKRLAESPRPTADLVRVTEDAPGYGFPSGHAMGVVLVFGSAAIVVQDQVEHRGVRWAVWTISVLAMIVTGFGRVFSGAHWPSDVLGGYLWGTFLLLVLLTGARLARRSSPRRTPRRH
ncbi:MAG: phosphatase PAP2 family protein [Chloroflexota bacterium]|nr:phosphatase PAP2 family protein [Chloroflexota bacterium]